MLFDLSLAELRVYKPEREEPADFDAFWADPSFVNGALADFTEFPACLPSSTPGYCPPAGGN